MSKSFSDKTRSMMLVASGGYCEISGCIKRATEFHHIVPNTKVNQKLFPLYLQSPMNCYPICNDCHMTGILPYKPTEEALYAYEEYLNGLSDSR